MAKQTGIIFDNEIRLMAKRANQRLVELANRGIKTPAAEATTAYLATLGRRRFSETGKGTRNQLERQKKALERFLNYETSTVTGFKRYRKKVEEGLKKHFNLDELGVSIDDILKVFEKLPQEKKDRLYGSDTYVEVVAAILRKRKRRKKDAVTDEAELSLEDIISRIDEAGSLKEALKGFGLSFKDLRKGKGINGL